MNPATLRKIAERLSFALGVAFLLGRKFYHLAYTRELTEAEEFVAGFPFYFAAVFFGIAAITINSYGPRK